MSPTIQFDTIDYTKYHYQYHGNDFQQRVNLWNKRAHRASMAATLRWADKLSAEQYGGKRLPVARWWAGDPYGKRPPALLTWANKVARDNPPQSFRYVPPADGAVGRRGKKGSLGKYCAASADLVRGELLKLGVRPEQLQ